MFQLHLLALSLTPLLAPLQERVPTQPSAPSVPSSGTAAEFAELLLAYDGAKLIYDEARVDAGRAGGIAAVESPLPRFWPRMRALADRGEPLAMAWMLKNVSDALPQPQERARVAVELFEKITAKAPEDECMLDALAGLQSVAPDVGYEEAAALAATLAQVTKKDEVAARALLAQASILKAQGRARGVADDEATDEILRSILYAYPGTKAARAAANTLKPSVDAAFRASIVKWVADVRAVRAAGKDSSAWPKFPLEDWVPQYVPLATAGNADSLRFTNTLAPSFHQAQQVGLGHSLSYAVDQLGAYYPRRDAGWSQARMDVLELVYGEFPDAPWISSSLKALSADVEFAAPRVARAAATVVVERCTNPKLRAHALLVRAQSSRRAGDQAGYAEAIADYRTLVATYPDENAARLARTELEALESVMPGRVAPMISLADFDGTPVTLAFPSPTPTLLVFWQFMEAGCADLGPRIEQFVAAAGQDALRVVGVNCDRVTKRTLTEQSLKLGWRWPTAVTQTAEHSQVQAWQVRRWPTLVLIDRDGIVRARDLPHDEMLALAKELARGSAPSVR